MSRTFASLCRVHRTRLRMTQAELASALGVRRGYIAMIEGGRANPTLTLMERLGRALSLDLGIVVRAPVVMGAKQRDLVHARCSGYVDRRLRAAGWLTAREVEVVHARSHGWIDVLAFHPGTGTTAVIEIKTGLDDLGRTERQLGWYVRSARDVAQRLGWRPGRVLGWLLVLASEEADRGLRGNRDVIDHAFPSRAPQLERILTGDAAASRGWGVALIDPSRRRRQWLMRARVDGRRSPAPYADALDAMRKFAA